jgi:hypothetical protein
MSLALVAIIAEMVVAFANHDRQSVWSGIWILVALLLAPFARTWLLGIVCIVWAAVDLLWVGTITGDAALRALAWVGCGFGLGGDLLAVLFRIDDQETWGTFRRRRQQEKVGG